MHLQLVTLLLAWLPLAASAAGTVPRFEPAPCPVEDPEELQGRAECGYLVVPETRGSNSPRTLRLAVAVVKAREEQPEPDPVMVLHGGPGGQLLRSIRSYVDGSLAEDRDVILLDQRGTGKSEPVLCPDLARQDFQPLAADLGPREEMARRIEAQLACRDELVAAGFDLGAFNSDASAADLNDLRRTLGYARWNLFGTSYGTKLALTTLRHFPEGVRSVVLDSAYPPGLESGARAIDFARALEELHGSCAADAACHAAYPDVRGMIGETLRALREKPLQVPVAESFPIDGDAYAVNPQDLLAALHQGLYDRQIIPALPFLITAIRDRNVEALTGFVDAMGEKAVRVNRAVYNTVECYERFPFWRETARPGVPSPWTELLREFVQFAVDSPVCAKWSQHRARPEEDKPVVSDVPTLILAGQYDPITPPEFGRQAAETLSQSRTVEFPHVGHVAFRSDDCPKNVVLQFLRDPQAELDLSCIREMEPPRFLTDVYVSAGVYRVAKALFDEPHPVAVVSTAALGGALFVPPFVWILAAILRQRRREPEPSAQRARRVTGSTAVLALVFLLGLLGAILATALRNPVHLALGLPGGTAPLFWLPWLVAGLTPVAFVLSVPGFRTAETTGSRLLLILALLGCAGSVAVYVYFELF
jgi:pimeloyl-ACP methyl ester carboxylesterase